MNMYKHKRFTHYSETHKIVKKILEARRNYDYSDEHFVENESYNLLKDYDIVYKTKVYTTFWWRLTYPLYLLWFIVNILTYIPIHWFIFGKSPAISSWHYKFTNTWAKKLNLA